MEQLVVRWITAHGSAALFGLLVLGVFGAPVPDETLLIGAGALVAAHKLGAGPTYAAAWLGSMAGITLSYTIGRFFGTGAATRYGRIVRLTPAHIEAARRWFEHAGWWALTLGYFVPGVRHLTAVLAGGSRMRPSLFASYAYGGALLWSASFITLGYYAGDRGAVVVRAVHHRLLVGLAVLAGAAIALVLATLIRRAARKERPR
jgi:membrane protein DedA with SNARE-associated domain